jgi:carboxypeptidase PM20D1
MLRRLFFIFILSIVSFAKAATIDSTLAVTVLSKFLQIASVSGNEKPAGEFLTNFCDSVGLYTRTFTTEKNSYNFATSLYPLSSKKPNIVFEGHLDVVPANDSLEWKYPPFSGTIAENAIWGRGAIDNKGPLVAGLMAILSYIELAKTTDLPFNITLLAVSGEETGGAKGAKIVAENYLDEIAPTVIWGEGGMGLLNIVPSKPNSPFFGISVNEKKPLWVNIISTNESFGHGSVSSSKNAVEKLIHALNALSYMPTIKPRDKHTKKVMTQIGKAEGGVKGHIIQSYSLGLYWELIKNKFRKDSVLYTFSQNTYSITQLSTPAGSINTVPQQAMATIDFRLMPETNTQQFLSKIKDVMGNNVKIEIILERPIAEATIPEIHYHKMVEATSQSFPNAIFSPFLFPAISDNNYFRLKGIPVYGFFPFIGDKETLSTIHNKNERMPIDKYLLAIKTYIQYLSIMQRIGMEK